MLRAWSRAARCQNVALGNSPPQGGARQGAEWWHPSQPGRLLRRVRSDSRASRTRSRWSTSMNLERSSWGTGGCRAGGQAAVRPCSKVWQKVVNIHQVRVQRLADRELQGKRAAAVNRCMVKNGRGAMWQMDTNRAGACIAWQVEDWGLQGRLAASPGQGGEVGTQQANSIDQSFMAATGHRGLQSRHLEGVKTCSGMHVRQAAQSSWSMAAE